MVHEIAHSWAGNLVSCQDCKHFWVNEGFTVKLERRILAELYGEAVEGLDAVAGRQTLEDFIKEVGDDHKYTSLVWPLSEGDDPDDFASCVPYEKGYNLLLWLEHRVKEDSGADFHGMVHQALCYFCDLVFVISVEITDVWMRMIRFFCFACGYTRIEFLRGYFDRFKYQAICSDDFESMFKEMFPETWKTVDFNRWFHGVGGCLEYAAVDTSLVDEACSTAKEWVNVLGSVEGESDANARTKVMSKFGEHKSVFEQWEAKQKLCFLNSLYALIVEGGVSKRDGVGWDSRSAKMMQDVYGFNSLRNSEMRFKWCQLALVGKFDGVMINVKEFVSEQGRMKFVRPLFKLLDQTYPGGSYGKELFDEVKESYHVLARKMIEKDLMRGAAAE